MRPLCEQMTCTSCRRGKVRCVKNVKRGSACDRCARLGRKCIEQTRKQGSPGAKSSGMRVALDRFGELFDCQMLNTRYAYQVLDGWVAESILAERDVSLGLLDRMARVVGYDIGAAESRLDGNPAPMVAYIDVNQTPEEIVRMVDRAFAPIKGPLDLLEEFSS